MIKIEYRFIKMTEYPFVFFPVARKGILNLFFHHCSFNRQQTACDRLALRYFFPVLFVGIQLYPFEYGVYCSFRLCIKAALQFRFPVYVYRI